MAPLELRRLWYLDGRKMALWSEPSRRRLRCETRTISQILAPHIPRSCTHVRGHGGVKGALRQIHRRMPKANFVARFDQAMECEIQHVATRNRIDGNPVIMITRRPHVVIVRVVLECIEAKGLVPVGRADDVDGHAAVIEPALRRVGFELGPDRRRFRRRPLRVVLGRPRDTQARGGWRRLRPIGSYSDPGARAASGRRSRSSHPRPAILVDSCSVAPPAFRSKIGRRRSVRSACDAL